MPSTSKKQHNFMAAAAHNPAFAKKVGISQTVAKEFNQADKGKKFKEGGAMKPVDMKKNPGVAKLPTAVRNKMGFMKKGGMAKSDAKEDTKMDKAQDKAMIKKAFKQHDTQEHKGGKGTKLALKKGGMAKCYAGGGMIDDEALGRAAMYGGMAGATMPRDNYEYSDAIAKMKRLGVKPDSRDYRIGMKTLTRGTERKELEDLLPSRAAIGSALREKLDPQTLVDAANPAGAATRRIAEAARDAKMPSSYSDASNMKKGGRVAAKGEHSVQKQSKRGAEMVKMARGGGIEIRGKTRGKMC
jgi:hypothetical protein